MIDEVTMNARKPGLSASGTAMLNRMNERHKPLQQWGLEHISIDKAEAILDIGYGGGQNIHNLCRLSGTARIWGIDHSEASYRKCLELNQAAVQQGRVKLSLGSAENLPYSPDMFDLVTAFETVYYWDRIGECFRSVRNVLKEKGAFLICNESDRENEELKNALHMNFYSDSDLKQLLLAAGFQKVHTYRHTKGSWICVVGIK